MTAQINGNGNSDWAGVALAVAAGVLLLLAIPRLFLVRDRHRLIESPHMQRFGFPFMRNSVSNQSESHPAQSLNTEKPSTRRAANGRAPRPVHRQHARLWAEPAALPQGQPEAGIRIYLYRIAT